jgi:hypothetical protein
MIPEPVAEFLAFRMRWLDLQPALADPNAPPLLRTLALLLEKEERLPATTAQIRSTVTSTALESQIAAATAAILLARFSSRPIPEICAMGGITLVDFSKSVAHREIFGLGEAGAGNKASKPASWSSRCGCCSAAAVASPPARRLASALCRCLSWKRWLRRCSISRLLPIWRPGWQPAKAQCSP